MVEVTTLYITSSTIKQAQSFFTNYIYFTLS